MILYCYRRTSWHCHQQFREGKSVQLVCLYFRKSQIQYSCDNGDKYSNSATNSKVCQATLTLNIFKLAHLLIPVLSKFCKTVEILEYQQKANAMSIFRKGKLTQVIDLVNYRPVSLISILKKIMEQLVQALIKKRIKGS